MIRHCAGLLEDFMVPKTVVFCDELPKTVVFCDELPKTDSGKISRREVAATLLEAAE